MRVGHLYFDGLEQADGSIIPVIDHCTRYENGTRTVRVADVSHLAGASAHVFPLGVREQVDTGYFSYIDAVRDRRVVAVDEARGLVLMIVVFDHSARRRTVRVRGVGEVELPAYHQVPNSVLIAELFKVRGGPDRAHRGRPAVRALRDADRMGDRRVKVTSFHFMPYRDLPDDAERRYRSMWVDAPWAELADAGRAGDLYHQSIDELMLAADRASTDSGPTSTTENPYGFMCNPNLFGAILARMTRDRGLDVALVQLGATLAATSPPIRMAEEYAVLDCLSGGRLVAGVPEGIARDTGFSYG